MSRLIIALTLGAFIGSMKIELATGQESKIAALAPAETVSDWKSHVHDVSRAVSPHVPSELIFAVIYAESAGQSKAVSPKGAQGLMQLMPGTAKRFGVIDSFNPKQNIRGGVTYLSELLGMFGMDPVRAVAAYNAGENRILRYDGVPPYPETMKYTVRVISRFIANASPNDPLIASLDQTELLRVARKIGGASLVDKMVIELATKGKRDFLQQPFPVQFEGTKTLSQQELIAQAETEREAHRRASMLESIRVVEEKSRTDAQRSADRLARLTDEERRRIDAANSSAAQFYLDSLIYNESMRMGVPIPLVKAIITVGSGWDAHAENQYGALGLMQLTPETARYYGATDPYDPEGNVRAGIQFLAAIRAATGEDPRDNALRFRKMQRDTREFDENDDAFARRVTQLYGAFYRSTASRGGFIKTGLNLNR